MEMERIFDRYIKFNKQEGNKIVVKVLRSHKALLISLIEEGIIKEPSLKSTSNSISSEARVGSVIQQLRSGQRKSIRQVAQEARVSPNHLWRIEQLLSSPTEGIIRKLAQYFDVPISFLFGEVSSTSNQIDPDNHDQI